MNNWTLFLLSSIFLSHVCAYKILVVFPYPGTSHSILGEGYVRHLLRAGHEVTYLTAIPYKKPHPNLKQVVVASVVDKFELFQQLNFDKFISKEIDMTDVRKFYEVMITIANRSLTHENIQKFLMESNERYDLVVAEWLYHVLYSGFAAIFNCPYIWSSSMEPHPVILSLIDEPGNPAYFPDHMSPVAAPMTFSERVNELWYLFYIYRVLWSVKGAEEKVYKEVFGPAAAKRGITLPELEDLKYNGSLVLGNSHISSGEPQRLPINHINIAGYHIQDVVPTLPENLQKIMDDADHGVIYFSMGSMMKSRTMPMKLKRDFLDVFGQLEQTVIWKLEEELTDLPKNVHIVQWAPQQSILGHPNCKLFVTHGGLLSTTETIHFGVPIIGIPLFADQFLNVVRSVRKGFALQVNLGLDTPAKLKVAIDEILSNPKYVQKVKELSFIYHHRETKPGHTLVHWIEHVIETNGALHLRSPALHMPFYQKMYLDLLALVLLVIIVLVKVVQVLLSSKKKSDIKLKRT
uniref:UDP-glucuronosyltransferase n=1 Tax=Heliothis virescens TaxID=7102 RepID=A0A2A4J6T0_HELVI